MAQFKQEKRKRQPLQIEGRAREMLFDLPRVTYANVVQMICVNREVKASIINRPKVTRTGRVREAGKGKLGTEAKEARKEKTEPSTKSPILAMCH